MGESDEREVKPFKVKKIVFHENPDLDCVGCYFLAMTYSQLGFLNIENAKVEFWSQGPPPDGRTAEEHEKEGTICFDVGEGRFDHHPHGQNGKPLNKCATDLVAEFLQVSDEPCLSPILEYIRMQDLEGPTSLSRSLREKGVPCELVKKASLLEGNSLASWLNNFRSPNNNRQVLERGYHYLSTIFHQQLNFRRSAAEEFRKKARIWWVPGYPTKIYKIATIESDIREVGSFSRTTQGGICDLCIQKEPESGFVYISGNLSSDEFVEIAKVLRVEELKARKIINKAFTRSDLVESRFGLSPVWYLPKNKNGAVFIIINGGSKAKSVEPTRLTLEAIEDAVVLGLNQNIFAENCPKTHCLLYQCSFYPYFLNRCAQIQKS